MLEETVSLLAAEIALVAVAVLIYVAGAFLEAQGRWRWIALAGLALAAAMLGPRSAAANAPLWADPLADYVRWLALAAGALFVLLAWRPLASGDTPEFLGSLLLLVAGLMLVAGARDLVLLFVGLELVSIPTYIILYVARRDAASQEAATKYFYLSILASAMLLYGFSFLYGAAGSMDLGVIRQRLAAAGPSDGFLPFAKMAMVLVFAGLGFRIAAVPFHFYAPDVFQGTTNANAGLLSVAPKIAGFVALVRVVAVAMPEVQSYAWPVAVVLAVLTMTLGNVLALWQDNLRRLLAYSSIAHAGYMLVGLAVVLAPRMPAGPQAGMAPAGGPGELWDGGGALLFYLVVYAAATIGTFAVLAALGNDQREVESVEELAGLAWTGGPVRPVAAWLLGLFMLSLAGIPPLAGFWGKLAVFASALSVGGMEASARPWYVGLAVIGVLNAAIAAAYYLRVAGAIFFRLPLGTPGVKEGARGTVLAAVLCAALVLFVGLYPGPWIRQANRAAPRNAAPVRVAAGADKTGPTSNRRAATMDHGGGEDIPPGARPPVAALPDTPAR